MERTLEVSSWTTRCANCRRWSRVAIRDSRWGHSRVCCSNACGKRLAQKYRNGTIRRVPVSELDDNGRAALRIRIKQLEHRIKRLRNA